MATFTICENFEAWAADPARKRSGECDYGCWWHWGDPRSFPRWRVSVIKATGEVYAVEAGHGARRFILLGKVTPGEQAYKEMDAIMGDWANSDRPDHNDLRPLVEKWG